MIPLNRGDIVLAAFPFTDLSMHKRRPALVLNENTDEGDVILAFIGSQVPSSPTSANVILESVADDFYETGLKTSSMVRLDKLATLERNLITRRIGKLSFEKMIAVDQALIQALRVSFPQS